MDVRSCWARAIASLIVALFLFVPSAFAVWQWANPLPQGNILDDLAWGGTPGHFVAVGQAGTVLVSATGAAGTWSVRSSGTLSWFQDIEWNGSEFLAVGTQGTILTSPDGEIWTVQPSQTSAALYAVTWTGNGYVVVGAGGTVVTSPDGRHWTRHATPTQEWLNDVAWSGQKYVAVGSSGAMVISADGITWDPVPAATSLSLEGVAWDGRQFVAVGQSGVVLTSGDGLNWVARDAGTTALLRKIEWSGGRFVVLGGNGTILVSDDGVTWTPEASTTQALLETIAVAPDGTQAVVGKYGTLLRKTDAGWESQLMGEGSWLRAVALHGTDYVAVGDGGTVLHGAFGQAPVRAASGASTRFNDVIWDGSRYLAIGEQGTVRASADGQQWSAHNWNTTARLNGLALGSSGTTPLYVAVGANGLVLAGSDVAAPTPQPSGSAAALNDVLWSGTQFVAVGEGGTILTSGDASTWVSCDSGTAESLRGIAYGNGAYVVAGTKGTVLVSRDGVQWTAAASGTITDLHGIAWDGARFIVAATSGAIPTGIFTSADGMSWRAQNVTGNDLFAVQAGSAGAVAVGEGGAVLVAGYLVEAQGDTATTVADTPVNIAVLANDFGAGVRVSATSAALHGQTTVNADNTITYTPATGFVGADAFEYTVADDAGKTAMASVAIEVQAATSGNTPPPDSGGTTPPPDNGGTTPPDSSGSTPSPESGGSTPPPDSGGDTPPSEGGGGAAVTPAIAHSGGGVLDPLWLLVAVGLWGRRRSVSRRVTASPDDGPVPRACAPHPASRSRPPARS